MKKIAYFFSLSTIPEKTKELFEDNLYYQFLQEKYNIFLERKATLSMKQFLQQYEFHHIVPKHAGGSNQWSNLVPLTFEDHYLAHLYRYAVYREKGDFFSCRLRKSFVSEPNEEEFLGGGVSSKKFKKLRKVRLEYWKETKQFFFSSDWQRFQASKGAKKGGSANTEKQRSSRSNIGKRVGPKLGNLYGPIQGRKNQSSVIQEKLKTVICWSYDSTFEFETPPCSTLFELAGYCLKNDRFRKIIQDSSLAQKTELIFQREVARQLSRLLRGERKSYYGWKIGI